MVSSLQPKINIIHSSDGGVDDFATSAVLAAASKKSNYRLSAIILTNADCEPISALSAYKKTVQILDPSIKVGLSTSGVWTQFPWVWRVESQQVDAMKCLGSVTAEVESCDGNDLMRKSIEDSDKTILVATGPLTTIAAVLRDHPQCITKVKAIHWMGGAIDVPGNIKGSPEVPACLTNDFAEWNVFCDPHSADWVFRNTSIPLYLYPLDISNSTIPKDFLTILNRQQTNVCSEYVNQAYQIVEKVDEYRMWDVVAVGGFLFPKIFVPPVLEQLTVITSGAKEGAIIRDDEGRDVFVFSSFKGGIPGSFYEAVSNIITSF